MTRVALETRPTLRRHLGLATQHIPNFCSLPRNHVTHQYTMAEPGPSSLRQPKPVYRGQNGFHPQVATTMSGPKRNLNAVADNLDTASKEELRELRDAVQRRQFVKNMMELKGTFFPGCVRICSVSACGASMLTRLCGTGLKR